MKAFVCLRTIMGFLLFSFITSCSGTKKMSLSCPEPVSKYPRKTAVSHHQKVNHSSGYSQIDKKHYYLLSDFTSHSKEARSRKRVQTSVIKQIPSPVTETTTSCNPEYTNNLYAAADELFVQVNETFSPIAVPQDKVADFRSDEITYKGDSIIQIADFDYNMPNLNYSGVKANPFTHYAASLQTQDTLYLKDGSKVAGKLVGSSRKEYRLQSSDGMVFTFTSDFVEKIVVSNIPSTKTEGPDSLVQEERRMIIPIGLIAGIAGIPFSIAGFITMGNIFWLGPILGALAIIQSSVSLNMIKKNPDKYYGKKPAIAGIIIGFAGIVLTGILLLILIAGMA
jgi:hypothetical protein